MNPAPESLPRRLRAGSLALVGGLAGCSTPAERDHRDPPTLVKQFAVARPDWAEGDRLDAVVLLYDPKRPTLGSGTVLASDLVLTAAHLARLLPLDADGTAALEIEGRAERVRIEACGDPERAHGDWALLRLAEPRFATVATLHAPAMAPEWEPAPGTELALAGFASGFYAQPVIDVRDPTPAVTVHACAEPVDAPHAPREPAQPPRWWAKGGRRDLHGMSGGACLIQGPQSGAPELIGVFSGYVLTKEQEVVTRRFLGIPMGQEVVESPSLVYTIERLPVAAIQAALQRGRRP